MFSPDAVAASDQSPDQGYRADLAACRTLLRSGSRSFHAASLLLPRSVRDPATALYAFCRVADDAIDHDGGRLGAVARLRERLARAYDGRPLPIPADRALAVVLARFAIPRALPEALLDGFAWDAAGRRYETLTELTDYAVCVAGTVGAMMAMLMGVRAPATVARACDLGVAMQLSNIARDVGEDAAAGRLYLPLGWLREAGIDPDAWLADPVFTPALGGVVQRLLAHADTLYARAAEGVRLLPLACRPGIGAARLLYAEIGHEVLRQGGDSVGGRAVVSGRRKLALLARSVAEAALPARATRTAPLAEARYLIDAVAIAPPPLPVPPPAWYVEDRLVWVLELFARLDNREQIGREQMREQMGREQVGH
jgi:phytoene synthase